MLELRNIHTYYGNIRAVRGISITVNENEMVWPDWCQRCRKIDDAHDSIRDIHSRQRQYTL